MKALNPQRVVVASAAGNQADIQQELTAALKNRLADAVLDLAGATTPESLLACLNNIKVGGILVIAGSLDAPLPLDTRKSPCLVFLLMTA